MRIQAVALPHRTRSFLEVRDATGTLRVQTEQANRLPPGDPHDFVGTPRWGDDGVYLADASFVLIRRLPIVASPGDPAAVESLRSLQRVSVEDIEDVRPVVVRAVVTYADPAVNTLMVQDDTSGSWVGIPTDFTPPPLGSEVLLSAFTSPGDFAPILVRPSLEILGRPGLPFAPLVDGAEFMSGRFDGQRVTLEGTVRSQVGPEPQWVLELMAGLARVELRFPTHFRSPLPQPLLGSHVRVTGVCTAYFNSFQQLGGFRLLVADLDHWQVLQPGPADLFATPPRKIRDLLRFDPDSPTFAPRLVTGSTLSVTPGHGLFVKDDTDTVEVICTDTGTIRPGDMVEVVGYPELFRFGKIMRDSLARPTGERADIAPVAIDLDTDRFAFLNGELVSIEAEFLHHRNVTTGTTLVLQAGSEIFDAYLPNGSETAQLDVPVASARVRVTGVVLVHQQAHDRVYLRLLMRDPADLVVTGSPPWWTVSRVLLVLALVILIAGAAFWWVAALRRRVRDQTAAMRDRLRKEAELERDYRNLFERTSDFIFRADIRGRIIEVNPAGAASLGYTPEEMSQLTAFQIVSRRDYGQLRRFYTAYRRKRRFSTADVHLVGKDGTEHIFEFTAEVVPDHHGRPLIQGIGRDITDRLQAVAKLRDQEARLQQAEKMEAIGTLAGGIAHDFNNILTGILGYVELIRADLPPASLIHPDLDQISAAGNRAKQLVRQILAYSRRMDHERRAIDLRQITTEACKLLRATIPTTVGIDLQVDPTCHRVFADATQMHQVILNLTTNAAQAMRSTGNLISISLRARRFSRVTHIGNTDLPAGDYVELGVADNGPGMTPEVQARIFEPYFTTKPVGEGSGMGLAVVHGIVQAHGGAIAVETKPGVGTRFSILLPATAEAPDAPGTAATARSHGTGHILLVDDEAMILALTRRLLMRMGYQVTCAAGGPEALAQLRAQPDSFDLVITDQTMPHMSGLDLLAALRREHPDVPVILCSGFHESLDQDTARRSGAAGLLPKPFDIAQLTAAITAARA